MFVKKLAFCFTQALPVALGVAILILATPSRAAAQAKYAGIGPGTYIQVGGTFSDYQIDYGQRSLGGAAVFVDAHLYRRIGAEAEVRTFRLNESAGVHETTYLIGPRFSFLAGRLRPYGKLLIGRGEFYYPFNYAKGSYFAIAPGGGVDWHIRQSKLTIRIVDVEIQNWPGFSFGALKPYGFSSGIAVRVF